jgi:carbonyl reductase 1
MSNKGRVAVVTGGDKGIGYHIALQLGSSGLFEHICITCQDHNQAQSVVDELQNQMPTGVNVCCSELVLGDTMSMTGFAKMLEERYSKIDVLVNNAGMAYTHSDPTPIEEQCKTTMNINFRGTCELTEKLLPLLRQGTDPRLINVISAEGRLSQLSEDRQMQFTDDNLTMDQLYSLVDEYERDVLARNHLEKGWGNSCYGMSKLALIAATKVWAHQEPDIKVDCCDPGYCKTDMTHMRGERDPADGAKCIVMPATMANPPTGQIFSDYMIASW